MELGTAQMSFRALTSGASAAASQTVTVPTGTQVGDTLIAIIGCSDTGTVSINSVPAGWTAIQSSPQARISFMTVGAWLRIYQNGDPTSWTWGFSGAPTGSGFFGCWCGNQDPTSSLDTSSVKSQASGTTAIVVPTMTLTQNLETVVMLTMSDGGSPMTAPAGYTSRINSASVNLSDKSFNSGATGTQTINLTANTLGAVSFIVGLFQQAPLVSSPNSRALFYPIQQRY